MFSYALVDLFDLQMVIEIWFEIEVRLDNLSWQSIMKNTKFFTRVVFNVDLLKVFFY